MKTLKELLKRKQPDINHLPTNLPLGATILEVRDPDPAKVKELGRQLSWMVPQKHRKNIEKAFGL